MSETIYKTLQDAYTNYKRNQSPKDGYVNYKTEQGHIRFITTPNTNHVIIHYIEVKPELRRKGIFTQLIHHIGSNQHVEKIIVCGMSNEAIEACMKSIIIDDRHFLNHGGDAIWTRKGNYCHCHQFNPDEPTRLGKLVG